MSKKYDRYGGSDLHNEGYTIGVYATPASYTRSTNIRSNGYDFSIRENLWEDKEYSNGYKWATTFELDFRPAVGSKSITQLLDKLHKIEAVVHALIFLEYTLESVESENVTIWEKAGEDVKNYT